MSIREFAHHDPISFGVAVFCIWVSLSLVSRVWLIHRYDPLGKRFVWTLILCVPFFGWLLYGAFYTPLTENTVKALVNRDAFYGGTGLH